MTYWPRLNSIKTKVKPITFVHIPKCAGSSVHHWMKKTFGKLNERLHSTIFQMEIFNLNIPSFTIIRNPFDRAFSWYKYRKQVLENQLKFNPNNSKFLKELDNWHTGFSKWIAEDFRKEWHGKETFDPSMKPRMFFCPQGNIVLPHAPMSDWIVDKNNRIPVDYVLRFENLDTEFQQIIKFTNSPINLIQKNISQVKLQNYKDFYNSNAKKIVQSCYQKDLDIFKYNF